MSDQTGKLTPEEGLGKSPSPAPASTADSGAGGRTGIKKILSGFASALGFGRGEIEKTEEQTTDVSTRLALERNYLAAERTLMGWIRTALSMISFGFTIGKLGQVLSSVSTRGIIGPGLTVSVESIAYFLVVLGTVALLGSALQHRGRVRELNRMGLSHQVSIAFTVSLLLVVVGGFAFTSLVMAL